MTTTIEIIDGTEYHVTRRAGRDLYGHAIASCDEGGCAGHERYIGATAPAYGIAYGTIVEEHDGIDEAREAAAARASSLAHAVDVVELEGAGPVLDSDGEEIAPTHAPARVVETVAPRCECGAWSGVRCARVLDSDAVAIDYMPEDLRSSHEVAGYASIAHARAGAERIRVAPECAAEMIDADGEWCAIVGEG